jgi:hypothetical protein
VGTRLANNYAGLVGLANVEDSATDAIGCTEPLPLRLVAPATIPRAPRVVSHELPSSG